MNFPFAIQSSWMIRPVWTEFDVTLGKMIQTSPSEGCQFSYPYHKAATVQDGEIKSPAQGMYASIPEVAKLLLHSGDLLVCEGGDIGRSAILESEPLCPTIFQNSIHRVRSKGNYPVEYLKLVLDFYRNSGWIYLFAGKSTISHFTAETFNALKIPFPTPEQAKEIVSIAKQLDKETKPLLRQLEKQRELLDEYRQSLITRAVTKGLDPNVPTKDAGLIWLGRIPEHWSYMRLAHCFTSVNRPANLDLPVLSVSIHTGISESELRDEERDRKVWLSEDRSKYQSIKEGDLVYNMMRAWQGGFGTSTRSGLVSPAYTVLSPNNGICSKYYELLFRTPNAQKMIYGYSQGIADFRKRLYWEKARDIYVPVPPYGEQLQIVNEVSKIEKRIETTKEIISKQIKLIAEYRESLISSFFASHDKS